MEYDKKKLVKILSYMSTCAKVVLNHTDVDKLSEVAVKIFDNLAFL